MPPRDAYPPRPKEVTAVNGIPALGDTVLNYIGGHWQAAHPEKWTERFDPADSTVLAGRAPDSSRTDARRAIQAAQSAYQAWRAWPAPRRGRLLLDWLCWIDARKEHLAMLLTREEGKILPEAFGEVRRSLDILEYTAGMGRRLGGRVLPPEDEEVFCYTNSQPLGVVGLISPWNFPVAIPVWKLAPALVAGNTCVLKPSPLTPMTAAMLVRGLEEVGLPAGVVNLVHGDIDPGAELIENEGVCGVSFTGSTKVGKLIARTASERLLKLQLELGGKNPVIVLEDADLDLAVAGTINGGFGSTGQRCTATSRAIIVGNRYDDFLQRLVDGAGKMRVGPGTEEGVAIGPLVDGRAVAGVSHYVEAGQNEQARLCAGGGTIQENGLDRGFFYQPTVLEATPDMEIAREEIFGPVVSVIRAQDVDEALRIANAVRYGLTASIFTRDVGRVFQFADRIESGMVHINRPTVGGYSHAPFGGIKESGYGGREVGDDVLDFYTEKKMVYVNYR